MRNRLITLMILILVTLPFAGCDDQGQTASKSGSKKSAKSNKKSKTPIVVEPEMQTPEYVYNPLGKRDPFDSPLRAIVEISSESGVPLTPLQKFDLGQLRLIGVIIGKGAPRAMVIAPDGKSFILKTGTKVGKNDGAVIDITTDSVLVKEIYSDFTGEVKTSIQEIKLPKRGGA